MGGGQEGGIGRKDVIRKNERQQTDSSRDSQIVYLMNSCRARACYKCAHIRKCVYHHHVCSLHACPIPKINIIYSKRVMKHTRIRLVKFLCQRGFHFAMGPGLFLRNKYWFAIRSQIHTVLVLRLWLFYGTFPCFLCPRSVLSCNQIGSSIS